MSMMIVANSKKLGRWIESFREQKSDIDIHIYPDIPDKEKIVFALVWSKNSIDFREFKNLKCIASMGAGVEHILQNGTIGEHTHVTKIIDEKLVSSMWEYLLCVVMNVVTNHYYYISQQRQKLWKPKIPKPLHAYTIGVMGSGQLGGFVAQSFSKMGFGVKAYARSFKHIKGVQSFTQLDGFLKDVDILINLLPATPATKGILNKELFEKIDKKAYIINVGRGEHLVVEDLLEAFDKGCLSGATLDVFAKEPLDEDSPLWLHPHIVITPHSASITDPKSVSKQIMDNYTRVSQGLLPNNRVNKERGY